MFSRAMRFVFNLLLIATILDATGGHWIALQPVAWTQMVVAYSRDNSLKNAISKTFDGAHPCELCKSIAQARQNEKKQDKAQINLKQEIFCQLLGGFILPTRLSDHFQVLSETFPWALSSPPLLTPPRSLSA